MDDTYLVSGSGQCLAVHNVPSQVLCEEGNGVNKDLQTAEPTLCVLILQHALKSHLSA